MKIFVEKIDNPDQKFWIWKEKITNKQDGRIYPTTVSNVGLGKSVAVYQENEGWKCCSDCAVAASRL